MKQITFEPFEIFIDGDPAPAGSKNSLVPLDRQGNPYRRKSGGVVVSTVDACKQSKPWKDAIRYLVLMQWRAEKRGAPVQIPLSVQFEFYLQRPLTHYVARDRNRPLRDDAPRYHLGKPDALKLARAAEDSMTGIVYIDDSYIVEEVIHKDYTSPDRPDTGVLIHVQSALDDSGLPTSAHSGHNTA